MHGCSRQAAPAPHTAAAASTHALACVRLCLPQPPPSAFSTPTPPHTHAHHHLTSGATLCSSMTPSSRSTTSRTSPSRAAHSAASPRCITAARTSACVPPSCCMWPCAVLTASRTASGASPSACVVSSGRQRGGMWVGCAAHTQAIKWSATRWRVGRPRSGVQRRLAWWGMWVGRAACARRRYGTHAHGQKQETHGGYGHRRQAGWRGGAALAGRACAPCSGGSCTQSRRPSAARPASGPAAGRPCPQTGTTPRPLSPWGWGWWPAGGRGVLVCGTVRWKAGGGWGQRRREHESRRRPPPPIAPHTGAHAPAPVATGRR